jgi:hypothetical protein
LLRVVVLSVAALDAAALHFFILAGTRERDRDRDRDGVRDGVAASGSHGGSTTPRKTVPRGANDSTVGYKGKLRIAGEVGKEREAQGSVGELVHALAAGKRTTW